MKETTLTAAEVLQMGDGIIIPVQAMQLKKLLMTLKDYKEQATSAKAELKHERYKMELEHAVAVGLNNEIRKLKEQEFILKSFSLDLSSI